MTNLKAKYFIVHQSMQPSVYSFNSSNVSVGICAIGGETLNLLLLMVHVLQGTYWYELFFCRFFLVGSICSICFMLFKSCFDQRNFCRVYYVQGHFCKNTPGRIFFTWMFLNILVEDINLNHLWNILQGILLVDYNRNNNRRVLINVVIGPRDGNN